MARENYNEGAKGLRPSDFELGSVESRAAARLKVARWFDGRKRITLIMDIPRPRTDNSRVSYGPWTELKNGTLHRIVHAPHVWLKPGEAMPACPDCGTPFRKTKEYPGMVRYAAACVANHDPDRAAQRVNMNDAINGGLLRPSDFPVGSPESRAAARAMAERRIKSFIRIKIVYVGLRGSEALPPPERIESEDSVTEIVHLAGSEQ
jgi:hypothetical protein